MEYMGGGNWECMDNVHSSRGLKGAGVLGARPVAEKKAVKTVAKIAVAAAAVYYGGSALVSAVKATSGASTLGSIVSTVAKGYSAASPYLTGASLAMQGIGMVKQYGESQRMAEAQNDANEAAKRLQDSQQRQSTVEAQRQRMAQIREQRIIQGRLTASAGQAGIGLGGSTSAFAGSTASLGTQLGTNIGNINVAEGFAREQGAANIAYGNAISDVYTASNRASGWQQIASLGKEFRGGESLAQSFEKVGTIFSIA